MSRPGLPPFRSHFHVCAFQGRQNRRRRHSSTFFFLLLSTSRLLSFHYKQKQQPGKKQQEEWDALVFFFFFCCCCAVSLHSTLSINNGGVFFCLRYRGESMAFGHGTAHARTSRQSVSCHTSTLGLLGTMMTAVCCSSRERERGSSAKYKTIDSASLPYSFKREGKKSDLDSVQGPPFI